MKKTTISLALAFLGIANLYAVKAKPGIAKIMLADGTIACATLHGDETFHYYMLLDGTPLRETQDGKYEKITAEELNTRKTRVFSSENLTRASEIGTVRPSYFPHKGSPKALVLLVQFQDVKFKSKDPVATFTITSTERREKLCLRLIKKCLSPTRLTARTMAAYSSISQK